jgi:hypothetical protein
MSVYIKFGYATDAWGSPYPSTQMVYLTDVPGRMTLDFSQAPHLPGDLLAELWKLLDHEDRLHTLRKLNEDHAQRAAEMAEEEVGA